MLLLGFVFLILTNLFGIYAPQVVREAIDYAENVLNSSESKETYDYALLKNTPISYKISVSLSGIFIFLGFLYLVVSVIKGIFLFFTRQTIIVMSRYIEFDLKNEIYRHYQALGLSFYKRQNTGDLMNRISEDVSRVRMYFGPAIMYTINMIILFILVIVAMLSINVKLTLYVLTPLPILSISIYFVSNIINKKSERVQNQLSNLSNFVQEAFSGIRVIKAYTKGFEREQKFETELEEYRSRSLGLVKVNAIFIPLMMLLIGLSTIITIYIGGKLSMAGEISTGNIAEFVIYVNMLTWPVAALGWVTSLVQRAAASQERINEFLMIDPDIKNTNESRSSIEGKIEFKDVSFVYPDSGIVALDKINFSLDQGKSLAIMGRTGSGKSTLANLICRLYDVTGGELFIDNTNIKELNLNDLRHNIGYVPQEDFLFSDDIANNIAFGSKDEEVSQADIESAAMKAQVHENIIDFPDGYKTKVGERGITLSGGQKQRISIARAIIKKPQILIFDDSLSAVDTETEEKIINELKDQMNNRTSLIISHRVSSVKHCNHILILDEGKIIEQGTHRELLALNGSYHELYQKQLLEVEEFG